MAGYLLGRRFFTRRYTSANLIFFAFYILPCDLSRGGLAPMPKPLPYALRFQSEHCTDRYEGEEPVGVITKKPLHSLLRRALDTPRLNLKPLLKTEQGIFEHCTHQRRLLLHFGETGRAEELLWDHADIGRPLIPGVPVGRHALR